MTPFQLHHRARRHGQALARLRLLTAAEYLVLCCMLEHACPRNAIAFTTTYDWLAKTSGRCRQTVADAVRKLDALGVIARFRSGRVVGARWRQNPNRYFILASSESGAESDTRFSKNPTGTGGRPSLWISAMQAAKRMANPATMPGRPLLPVRTVAEQLAFLRGMT